LLQNHELIVNFKGNNLFFYGCLVHPEMKFLLTQAVLYTFLSSVENKGRYFEEYN